MSQDPSVSATPSPPPVASAPEMPDHVYLVSYPKIVFLYPTVLTALFCSIVMWAKGDIPTNEIVAQQSRNAQIVMKAAVQTANEAPSSAASADEDAAGSMGVTPAVDAVAASESAPAADGADSDVVSVKIHSYHHVCARIFLIVFALNMVVISFDFPRTTSLTWFFAITAIVIGLWFLFSQNPGLAPKLVQGLLAIKPWANASFYMIYTMIMLFLYMWVMISRRFDYWEVKGNELLHHHGFLSNLERFSAPNLRIDKEINDLFEYMLLRSGRLIIHASNERRAIVLENVLFINGKEDRITRMLGALQVRVRTDKE
ncbi:MAG: hypothetical protein NT138_17115 [Planctomycetales bacterium]|jgi:hypothetical protein|nr:hypothetical protein [Planctomycetales bacterium]